MVGVIGQPCRLRHAGWLLLLLASCRPELRPPPATQGLKTRLIVAGAEFVVGKPLDFRLELTNESASTFVYDGQGVEREGAFVITDSEGKEVPYTDIPRQTSGHDALLRPGETVVLIDGYDPSNYYLLARPGRYQIQFTGNGLSIIDARKVPLLAQLAAGIESPSEDPDHWFDEVDKLNRASLLVPSNTLTLNLKPGRPPSSALLSDRLLKILPEGWTLGVSNVAKPGQISIHLLKLTGLKSETARVEVIWTGEDLKDLGDRICAWDGGNIYASPNPKAAELWPDFRTKVAEALAP
jgi:hypothetical protein